MGPSPLQAALTAGSAVVTDDGQQVVAGDMGRAVLGEKGLHIKAGQREGDVCADLGGKHELMAEAL